METILEVYCTVPQVFFIGAEGARLGTYIALRECQGPRLILFLSSNGNGGRFEAPA